MVATGDFQTDSWNTYQAIHEAIRDPSASPEAIEFHNNLLTALLHDNDFAGQLWSQTREHSPELFDAVQRDVNRARVIPLAEGAYDAAQERITLLREGQLDGLTVITPQEATPEVLPDDAPAEETLAELLEAAQTGDTIAIIKIGITALNPQDLNPEQREAIITTFESVIERTSEGELSVPSTSIETAQSTLSLLGYTTPEVTLASADATITDAAPTPSPHTETTVTAAVETTEISTPDAIDLTGTQLDAFWNAEANFRLASLDPSDDGIGLHTYTHVVGDPRYVEYFNQYVAANGLEGADIDALRAEVVAAHQDAAATLATIEYDGLQMAYYGSSQDFYTAVETENYSALGADYTDPAATNIFTGLGVTQPLAPEVLTEIQAPLQPERPDVFVNEDMPVVVVSPEDPFERPDPGFFSALGSVFVGAAHAGTLPADMDTASPAPPPSVEEATEVANDGIEPVELSFSDEITTSGGITEFATSERLTFGAATDGATITDPLAVSFDTAQFLTTASAEAEATSTPYTTLQTDTSLTQIMHDHYGDVMDDSGMAYRAALIVAAANDLPNADNVPDGTALRLPSLDVLQEAAGSDTLRLRNLGAHPQEIGATLTDMMNGDTPEVAAAMPAPDRAIALG